MRHFHRFILCFLAWGLLFGAASKAQASRTISGYVTDLETGAPLEGVTVILTAAADGCVTDASGFFRCSWVVTADKTIRFSYVGYETFDKGLDAADFAEPLKIKLRPSVSILQTAVVTGSSFEREITQEVVSVEVIKPAFFKNNIITSLDQAMSRVPGVQIVEGQANVRSSGYSQGSGSRVGVFVDDLPLLNADFSSVPWNFIPIENAAQVEITKGAASVLYGSAALNGVVSVQLAPPVADPYTSVALYRGFYNTPKKAYQKWWENADAPPLVQGVFVAHRQKIGKLDVTFGGNAHQSIGYIKNDDEERYRAHLYLRYRVNDRFTVGLKTNGMWHSVAPYFLWLDSDTNIMRSIDTLIADRYYNFTLDPFAVWHTPHKGKHEFRARYFRSIFVRNRNDDTPANMANAEYRYQQTFGGNVLTTGVNRQSFFARSPQYRPDSLENVGESNGTLSALYAQWEQGFFSTNAFGKENDFRLKVIAGLRYEWIEVPDAGFKDNFPIGRLGATYRTSDRQTFRFNIGQGYRLPSLTERFNDRVLLKVENPFGIEGVSIIPNEELLPEYGWSSELAYKLTIGKTADRFNGYLDVAAFWMQYEDFVNLEFDFHKDLGRGPTIADILLEPELLGFRYRNTSQSRIAGFEISSFVTAKIVNTPFRIWTGYTFTYPANMDTLRSQNANYWTNFAKAFTFSRTDTALLNSILTYRSLHVFRWDAECYLGKFTLGFAANYNSQMVNIDPLFEGRGTWGALLSAVGGDFIVKDLQDFRAQREAGDWVFDARLGWHFAKHHALNFAVQNVWNTEYSLRTGRVNPPRTFLMQYQLSF